MFFPKQSVEKWEDILYDLEETRKAEPRIAEFFERGAELPEAIRGGTRGGLAFEGRVPEEAGQALISRCDPVTRRRYNTLVYFEADFERSSLDADFGYLIGPACQILELELGRLLADP